MDRSTIPVSVSPFSSTMKFAAVVTIAACVASASALSTRAAATKYDVYLKVTGCRNLDSESEPYVYAGKSRDGLLKPKVNLAKLLA